MHGRDRAKMTMDTPVFVSMTTANRQPYLLNASCAEAVVTTIFYGRDQGWFALKAFSVLPDEVQMVVVSGTQQPESILRSIRVETAPLLGALVRTKGGVWDRRFRQQALRSADMVRAQIESIHRMPVKLGLSERPSDFPFCSANPRFHAFLDRWDEAR